MKVEHIDLNNIVYLSVLLHKFTVKTSTEKAFSTTSRRGLGGLIDVSSETESTEGISEESGEVANTSTTGKFKILE